MKTQTQMTPKDRRDAQIELRDWARYLEENQMSGHSEDRGDKFRRAQFLRAVAAELDNVPEIQ